MYFFHDYVKKIQFHHYPNGCRISHREKSIIRKCKGGNSMVNEDFKKFNKVQQQHQGEYLGTDQKQKPGINDREYNNQDNTDISVGATGRE
jgi:hypothetical protein